MKTFSFYNTYSSIQFNYVIINMKTKLKTTII